MLYLLLHNGKMLLCDKWLITMPAKVIFYTEKQKWTHSIINNCRVTPTLHTDWQVQLQELLGLCQTAQNHLGLHSKMLRKVWSYYKITESLKLEKLEKDPWDHLAQPSPCHQYHLPNHVQHVQPLTLPETVTPPSPWATPFQCLTTEKKFFLYHFFQYNILTITND